MLKTGIKLDILIALALLSLIGLFVLFYGRDQRKSPEFSIDSGLYEDSVILEMRAGFGAEIRYTTDGSEPTKESILYDKPITLTDATVQNNRISAREDLSIKDYDVPGEKIDKANIIKAKAYYFNNDEGSEVVVGNFLVKSKEELKTFAATDLLFISANTEDLVDYENGMMVKGAYFDGFLQEEAITVDDVYEWNWTDRNIKANYSSRLRKRFEKKAFLQYIRKSEKVFEGNYGIGNRGVSSSDGPKKTYNLYYREEFSKQYFAKELFDCGVALDKLVLRREDCIIHDALYEKLFSGTEMLIGDQGVPVQIFINGEYWGLYCLDEKMDENWFSTHAGVSGDRVTVLKNNSVSFGKSHADEEMEELIEFCASHDMTENENYNYFCSQVDIDSFLLYYAAMFYLEACDFSETYNTMQWRTEGDKWHWALYDLDNSAHNASHDTLNGELKKGKDNAIGNHTMFDAIMYNKKAQEVFIDKIDLLKNILSYSEVKNVLDLQKNELMLAGKNDNERWGNTIDWEDEVNRVQDFFEKRQNYVDLFVMDYLATK